MRRTVRRLASALVALTCLGALAACGDGEAEVSTDPVEVEVGEAFEWNGFAVADGWELNPVERTAGADEVTTPEVRGTITNELDEERAAIFEMVFSTGGEAVARLSCSAARMAEGQSTELICPGLSATMPQDYDAVVVQEYVRDGASS